MGNTIHTTTDYGIFQKLLGNRSVTEKRKREIKKSILSIGWITNPIIVNEKMEIIDGQGRLEVLKELGLPVEYIVIDGISLKECQEINTHTFNWTADDMIRSFADNGNESCIYLVKLMEEFHLSPSTAIIPLEISHNMLKVNAGKLVITDEMYQRARGFFLWLKTVEKEVKNLGGRLNTKIKAIYYCYSHGADPEELRTTILKIEPIKFNTTTAELAIKGIQDVYNYGKKKKSNRIYVYESYRKGE